MENIRNIVKKNNVKNKYVIKEYKEHKEWV